MAIARFTLTVGCLLLALAAGARADDRMLWVHRFGSFEKDPGKWTEVLKGKKTSWEEKAQTAEYVELFEPKQKVHVRLYANRCEVQSDPTKPDFTKLYDGEWTTREALKNPGPAPKPVVDKPGERERWEAASGIFYKKVKDDQWAEVIKGKSTSWTEKARTQDYVELYQSTTKLTMRLFADHSEQAPNPDKLVFRRSLEGKWAKDATVAVPPDKADDRVYWKHKDGYFEKGEGDTWVEVNKDKKYSYDEKKRTDDVIELFDGTRKVTLRLHKDHCDLVKTGAKPQPLFVGAWAKPDAPAKPFAPVATGKAEDRDYWKYKDGYFEKGEGGKWQEVAKDAKYEYLEKDRNDNFVELYDESRKVTLFMYPDRVETPKRVGNRTLKTKVHDGHWGKEAPAEPARAKAQWVDSVEKMKFPEGMVSGKLKGVEFNPNEVKYDTAKRTIQFLWYSNDKKQGIPELRVEIQAANQGNTSPPIRPTTVPENVTLQKNFKEAGNARGYILRVIAANDLKPSGGIGIMSFPTEAFILQYDGKKGDKLVGKVYICLGDDEKSYLAGSFEATIEQARR